MRERLGKYELVTLMSVGGMAELYLASMAGPGGFRKPVALKQVLPELRGDPQFVGRFLDEARITAALTHPHIGQVFDLGEAEGELYLAMEFVNGVDLARLASAPGGSKQLPPAFVARVGRDIALALASAHELKDPASNELAGLIHRDINPRNVMLTFDGIVKVVDFGLARFRGRRVRTAVGLVRGTRQYMAPEQLRDDPLDARTDQYGLGVLLWELLTGRFLVQSDSELEALAEGRVSQRAIEFAPQTPEGLDAVVMTCLHPDPAQRFSSARELARALERCGVELFDEAQLASFVGARLPETQRALQRLVGLAQQPEVDEGAVKAELRSLRSADKGASLPPRRVEPVTTGRRPLALPQPERSFAWPVLIAVGVTLMAGLGVWFGRGGAATPAETPDSFVQAERLRARGALNSGDPLLALEIIRRCVTARGPCTGMDSVRSEAEALLDASPCGTDAKARAWVDEAYFHRTGAAIDARLRECTAGKRMHPLAAQVLRQREIDGLVPSR